MIRQMTMADIQKLRTAVEQAEPANKEKAYKTGMKDVLSVLTVDELKESMIAMENTLGTAADLVFSCLMDALCERVGSDEFCAFCDHLDELENANRKAGATC